MYYEMVTRNRALFVGMYGMAVSEAGLISASGYLSRGLRETQEA